MSTSMYSWSWTWFPIIAVLAIESVPCVRRAVGLFYNILVLSLVLECGVAGVVDVFNVWHASQIEVYVLNVSRGMLYELLLSFEIVVCMSIKGQRSWSDLVSLTLSGCELIVFGCCWWWRYSFRFAAASCRYRLYTLIYLAKLTVSRILDMTF
jgi:hypothetical protein